jgi:hypothetical protein
VAGARADGVVQAAVERAGVRGTLQASPR